MRELKSQFSLVTVHTSECFFHPPGPCAAHFRLFSLAAAFRRRGFSLLGGDDDDDGGGGEGSQQRQEGDEGSHHGSDAHFSSMWDLSSRPEIFSVGLASSLLLRSDGQT